MDDDTRREDALPPLPRASESAAESTAPPGGQDFPVPEPVQPEPVQPELFPRDIYPPGPFFLELSPIDPACPEVSPPGAAPEEPPAPDPSQLELFPPGAFPATAAPGLSFPESGGFSREAHVLAVLNLHKRFGRKEVVRGVNFFMHNGEVAGLLG
ncbi:MAG: hypothetical protein LBT95_10325, partial [Treponema sp.]|nr:hypothetical protein [Treponema sp.]